MSLSDGTPMMTMPGAPANTSNGNGFGWGGDGAWWIVLFLIFAAFGGWGNGFGFGGGGGFFCSLWRQDWQFIPHQCFYRYGEIICNFLLCFRIRNGNTFFPV